MNQNDDRERNRQYNTNQQLLVQSTSNTESISTNNDDEGNIGQQSTINNNDQLTQQLFNAYFDYFDHGEYPYFDTIVSILSTSLSTTPTFNIIKSFMELRSQFIGPINGSAININKNVSLNDDILLNVCLFKAALSTNSPKMIDDIMVYINYDFTTLNIPYDQVDEIRQMNNTNRYESNCNKMLSAIVHAIKNGHYQSILHLINNYHLSPSIPIDNSNYGIVDFFFYSIESNNRQLVEYLLPFSFSNIGSNFILCETLTILATQGHLNVIKSIQNQYNIDLAGVRDSHNQSLLYYALLSNNIEMVDYLVEDIGLDPNENALISIKPFSDNWQTFKHFTTKYNINIYHMDISDCFWEHNPSIEYIDFLISTFNITEDDINSSKRLQPSPLFSLAANNNIIAMKHLIENYNANPHFTFYSKYAPNQTERLANFLLQSSTSLEMIEYLRELGINFNFMNPNDLIRQADDKPGLKLLKLLFNQNIIIDDNINDMVSTALKHHKWSILQYLMENYQPSILHDNAFTYQNTPLICYAMLYNAPLEFITYLLSLHTVDLNGQCIKIIEVYIKRFELSIKPFEVLKLLIDHGLKLTIDQWVQLLRSYYLNTISFFKCFELCTATISNINENELFVQQLIRFASSQAKFSHPKYDPNEINPQPIFIYHALIHHYKINVNVSSDMNTILHFLALKKHKQSDLLQFTLIYSDQKPNLELVNKKNQTFLHLLVLNEYYDENGFDCVIDCVIQRL